MWTADQERNSCPLGYVNLMQTCRPPKSSMVEGLRAENPKAAVFEKVQRAATCAHWASHPAVAGDAGR